jgi:hypothetical protein
MTAASDASIVPSPDDENDRCVWSTGGRMIGRRKLM